MVMTFQQPCKERTWHLPKVELSIRFLGIEQSRAVLYVLRNANIVYLAT